MNPDDQNQTPQEPQDGGMPQAPQDGGEMPQAPAGGDSMPPMGGDAPAEGEEEDKEGGVQ